MRVVLLPDSAWPVCACENIRKRWGRGRKWERTKKKNLDGFLASFESSPRESNVVVNLLGYA